MGSQNVRAIVLGAAGFIGRWVARSLPAEWTTYLVVRDAGRFHPIAASFNIKGSIVNLDLIDQAELERFIAEIHPSIVFNFAGYGVDPKEKDSQLANLLNAQLPRKLCELIVKYHDSSWNGQQLLHAGSALEYGIAKGALAEEVTPRPSTQYGISKFEGTQAVLKSPCRTAVVRLFNVYGPGEHPGRLLPALIEAARTGEKLALTAGTQKRDFTYVEDVADGCCRLSRLTQKLNSPVHLATGKLHTVREFAETAARLLRIPADRLQFGALPFRKEEMDHEHVSIERMKSLTGWTPDTSIEVGIRKTISFPEPLPS